MPHRHFNHECISPKQLTFPRTTEATRPGMKIAAPRYQAKETSQNLEKTGFRSRTEIIFATARATSPTLSPQPQSAVKRSEVACSGFCRGSPPSSCVSDACLGSDEACLRFGAPQTQCEHAATAEFHAVLTQVQEQYQNEPREASCRSNV